MCSSNSRMDPLNRLPSEVCLRIIECALFRIDPETCEPCADPRQMLAMALVGRSWLRLVRDPSVWHRVCLWPPMAPNFNGKIPSSKNQSDFMQEQIDDGNIHQLASKFRFRPVLNHPQHRKNQFHKRHDDFGRHLIRFAADPEQLFSDCRHLSDWLYSSSAADNEIEITRGGISASSTDDSQQQSIQETLRDDGNMFWSSTGSVSPNANEHLVYSLVDDGNCPCLVTRIEITPYKAIYMRGMPIFAPQALRLQFSLRQPPESTNDRDTNDPSSDCYHFESKVFPVERNDKTQSFSIYPSLILASFIRLDLLGKRDRQHSDQQYYTVLKRVRCFGVPLSVLAAMKLHTLTAALLKWTAHLRAVTNAGSGTGDTTDAGFDRLYGLLSLIGSSHVRRCTGRQEMLARVRASILNGNWLTTIEQMLDEEVFERTPEILGWFDAITTDEQRRERSEPVRSYISLLLVRGNTLNWAETMELARECVADGDLRRLATAVLMHRVVTNETLGDLVRPYDGQLAMWIYSQNDVLDKILSVALETQKYRTVIFTIWSINYPLTYGELMQQILCGGDLYTANSSASEIRQFEEVPFEHPSAITIGRLREAHQFVMCVLREESNGVLPVSPPQPEPPTGQMTVSQLINQALEDEFEPVLPEDNEPTLEPTATVNAHSITTLLQSLDRTQRASIQRVFDQFPPLNARQTESVRVFWDLLRVNQGELNTACDGRCLQFLASKLAEGEQVLDSLLRRLWPLLTTNVHLYFAIDRRLSSMPQ